MKIEAEMSLDALPFTWVSFLFLILSASLISASSYDTYKPRLGVLGGHMLHDPAPPPVSDDIQTFFYNQTLDHFNYRPQSYATFRQRYMINSKHWGGAESSSPIFVYLGAEGPIDNAPFSIGFLNDNAPHFKSLQVFIEHRYYGQSIPFGTFEEALRNESTRGYFSSAQALADYAEVILYLKEKLNAQNSPVIVAGGSYGGMLASWFRLKYPHVALGALASSAPILYFDNITPDNGYYSIVTKDFKEASESCYETIRKSWSEIDNVASQPNGLLTLTQKFRLCRQLEYPYELIDYLDGMYSGAAQYNHPPRYPVTQICSAIDGAPQGSHVLDRIVAGMVAYKGNQSCYNTTRQPSQTSMGWGWQTCSEMVMPIGRGINDTMFPPEPFDLDEFIEDCKSKYGVSPRPHWITSYYGGHDTKLVLHKFGSNIIFSNGLRDPYSSGGVLEDISDTVLAVSTAHGSHCLDIHRANQSTDPQWLVQQRQVEVQIIEGWISKYYDDLQGEITKLK